MKFIYTQKAKDYIRSRNIKDLYIKPYYNGGLSCGIMAIRLSINPNPDSGRFYIRDYFDGINTNYDPIINEFQRSSKEIIITTLGFGKLKKLVSQTEFSSVKLD